MKRPLVWVLLGAGAAMLVYSGLIFLNLAITLRPFGGLGLVLTWDFFMLNRHLAILPVLGLLLSAIALTLLPRSRD